MKKIFRGLGVVIVVAVLGLVYIYIDSGKIDAVPSMVTYLKKYAGRETRELSQEKYREDGYNVVDTYFEMDGGYRFHYICKNRLGLKINDNVAGCKYYFDGGEKDGYRTFFDYFNDENEVAVEEMLEDYDGVTGTVNAIDGEDAELEKFFREYLELPNVADFYKVCYGRKHSWDYSEWELSCNENFLRVRLGLWSDTSPQSIFEWAVERGIEPKG